jgi:enterochelin esterase-like enzyme
MKYLLIVATLLGILLVIIIKTPVFNNHRVELAFIDAPSLKNNPAGEEALRELFIYLPTDYATSDKHYPVVYYLHGFGVDHTDYFGLDIDGLMDKAIKEQISLPFILVVPNGCNKFRGSFYFNSPGNGNWTDYIAKDVVNYVDEHYRTISNKNSRGLCGHSMGGQGALRVSMLYPDVFGSVYAMSPSILNWGGDFHLGHDGFKNAIKAQTFESLKEDSYALAFIAMGRVFSPNQSKRPFGVNMPIVERGGEYSIDSSVFKLWEAALPINMLGQYGDGLKQLNGLKIDWGNNDDYAHIPTSCRQFCDVLDKHQIPHEKDQYEGGHYNRIPGKDGRFYQQVIPFFSKHLSF